MKTDLVRRVLDLMTERRLSKTAMATAMGTTRTQLDRFLDPANGSTTLDTLARAATVLGLEARLVLAE